MQHLSSLSDDALLSGLDALCAEGHRLTARTIAYLVEVEHRSLHLKAACSSLFDFCVRRLGLSEGAAYRRITAARLVKDHPQLLARIETGEVHLSTLTLLRDHLTVENVDELVATTSKMRKHEVQALIARRAPRPDVPGKI